MSDPGDSRCSIRDSFEVEKAAVRSGGMRGRSHVDEQVVPRACQVTWMDVEVIDGFCAGCQGGLLQLKEDARDIWQKRNSQILGAR